MSVVLPVTVLISAELVSSPERLEDLLARIQDFSPVLEEVGSLIEEALAENYATRGFGTWAGLAQSTLRQKERHGYDGGPLVKTGTLLAALTQRDAAGHKFLVQPDSVSVGVYGEAIAYAQFLSRGTRRMPARVLVQLTPGTVDAILALIVDWLGGPDGVTVTAGLPSEA